VPIGWFNLPVQYIGKNAMNETMQRGQFQFYYLALEYNWIKRKPVGINGSLVGQRAYVKNSLS